MGRRKERKAPSTLSSFSGHLPGHPWGRVCGQKPTQKLVQTRRDQGQDGSWWVPGLTRHSPHPRVSGCWPLACHFPSSSFCSGGGGGVTVRDVHSFTAHPARWALLRGRGPGKTTTAFAFRKLWGQGQGEGDTLVPGSDPSCPQTARLCDPSSRICDADGPEWPRRLVPCVSRPVSRPHSRRVDVTAFPGCFPNGGKVGRLLDEFKAAFAVAHVLARRPPRESGRLCGCPGTRRVCLAPASRRPQREEAS